MSFLGIPNDRKRRLAPDEATAAIEKYGDQAAEILLMKVRQTQSARRRAVYKVARKIVMNEGSTSH